VEAAESWEASSGEAGWTSELRLLGDMDMDSEEAPDYDKLSLQMRAWGERLLFVGRNARDFSYQDGSCGCEPRTFSG
jgi:hypothetical protein